MIFLWYNMNANLFLFRLLKITVSLTMVVDREIGMQLSCRSFVRSLSE